MRKLLNILACLALCLALTVTAVPARAVELVIPDDVGIEGGEILEPVEPEDDPDPIDDPDPTPEPTPEPTAEPTPEPTPEPIPSIEPDPTAEPTAEPTPEPTVRRKSINPQRLVVDGLMPGSLREQLEEMGMTPELYPLVQQLTIASGEIGEADFEAIREMSDLRSLVLTDASVEDETLPDGALQDMAELREVHLPAPGAKEKDRFRVTAIGERAFKNCARMNDMSALQKIESVGDEAFLGCARLPKMKMPSLVSVGDSAFSGCVRIAEFDFSSVQTIGTEAFSGCTALKSASLSSASTVGVASFQDCTGLSSVKLGADGCAIGDYAFQGCTALSSAALGRALNIGAYAFSGDQRLTSIQLTGCYDLGEGAFSGCRRLEAVAWPKRGFDSVGADAFDGCAIDFSKGFPKGLSAKKAGLQRPRLYFSLSETKATVFVDEDWDEPAVYLRTRRGTSFKSILSESWVHPSVELPKVTRKPKTVYTDEPGKQTITYSIPDDIFADEHKITYTLRVIEDLPDPTPTPTPVPTPSPTPRPTPPPEDELADAIWATLPGLTLPEMEQVIGREVYDLELREDVKDYAAQQVHPIDLATVTADEETRIPLVSAGYQVGELVITRSVDDPETPDFEEESGLTFSLEPGEGVDLYEATLQIATMPELIDPFLAQRPAEALPDLDADEDASSAEDEAEQLSSFYPFDALLDVDGKVLLYVNAHVEYDPIEVPVYAMDLEQRAALTELMKAWIIPSEEEAETVE